MSSSWWLSLPWTTGAHNFLSPGSLHNTVDFIVITCVMMSSTIRNGGGFLLQNGVRTVRCLPNNCTGARIITSHRLREYEVKKLRFHACSRLEKNFKGFLSEEFGKRKKYKWLSPSKQVIRWFVYNENWIKLSSNVHCHAKLQSLSRHSIWLFCNCFSL